MTLWAFRSLSFAVVMDGPIFDEWFQSMTERTIDPVLGGTVRYVDIGGTSIPPMAQVMQFTSTGARTTMQGYRGTTGTLTDDNGRTATALLADLTPIRVKNASSGIYRLSAVFEYVSP